MVYTIRKMIDVDWVGNIDETKSTSGGAFFLGKRLVTQTRKTQNCISQSTTKAEYVIVTVNCTNVVWIKQLLKGMKEEITKPMVVYCDNTSTIKISKNLVMHTKIKHIAIKYHYHYLRELVEEKRSKDGICEYKRTYS